MHVNKRNILICIFLVILLNLTCIILLNIFRNEYISKVIKTDSQEMLRDYATFSDIDVILNKYLNSIKNSEYNKINDMSIFNAKKSNAEYDMLKNKLEISDSSVFKLVKVYILEKNIYKCIFSTNFTSNPSKENTIYLKLDRDKKYFRVLDFTV